MEALSQLSYRPNWVKRLFYDSAVRRQGPRRLTHPQFDFQVLGADGALIEKSPVQSGSGELTLGRNLEQMPCIVRTRSPG